MKDIDKVLLALCDSYINAKPLELGSDIDYDELFRKARAHNLIGICHCALQNVTNKEMAPKEFQLKLQNAFFELIYLFELQTRCYNDIKSILSASQTPYIAFKGIKLRELYPIAEARSMGDIDLLIRSEDRDEVRALLTKNGFACTRSNGPVYKYERDEICVEVHTSLIDDYNDGAFADAFEHAVFNGVEGCLEDTFHFAYLIAHIAHHFKFYGAGIKLLLDLAVMLNKTEIDLDKALDYLSQVGLDKFAEVILSVCFKWFGVGKDYGHDTRITENYLCFNGAFGNENTNTGSIVTRRELEQGGSASPLMIKLRLAFPSYERLRGIDYIRFIDGRPWLTPYAWCYRFIYNLKNRKEFTKNTVNKIGDEGTKARAERELEFFKEIGLI